MSEISKQQKKFLEEYATSLNIKNSAILADYSEKIALKQGRYFLSKEKYLKALNGLIEAKVEHLEIPKSYIIKKFIQLIDWASGESKQKAGNTKLLGNFKEDEQIENTNEEMKPQNEPVRAFKEPKDPAILLRALEGLVKFLERGRENSENSRQEDISAIIGVNCEKI